MENTRWTERFEYYSKALSQLNSAILKPDLSELEIAGVIQYFEFTFELAWKTIKDFLELEGHSLNTPREILKKAFEIGLILDGEKWLNMLEKRNLLSHTYSQSQAENAFEMIKYEFTPQFFNLKATLDGKNI